MGRSDEVTFDPDEFLEHFGVKGMKWGVRKDKGSEPKSSPSKEKGDKELSKELAKGAASGAATSSAFKLIDAADKVSTVADDSVSVIPKETLAKIYGEEVISGLDTQIATSAGMGAAGGLIGYILKKLLHGDVIVESSFEEEFLAHYGVKGMKWGVRRTDAELGRSSKKKAAPVKPVVTPVKPSESTSSSSSSTTPRVIKGIDDLTTTELQQLVNRLNLEQQYSKLTAAPPKEKNEAKAFVQGLMKEVAKESTRAIARGVGRKAVKKIGKKYKFEPVYSKK